MPHFSLEGVFHTCRLTEIEKNGKLQSPSELMHGSILPVTIPPTGQPRGQVQPFKPGGGELFEVVLSRG